MRRAIESFLTAFEAGAGGFVGPRTLGALSPAFAWPAHQRAHGLVAFLSGAAHAVTSARVARELTRLLRWGLPIHCGARRTRYVALTFDDGPGPYSWLALRILRRAHVTATFFLVGKELQYWPSIPAREARLGALGDHTWTHPALPRLTTARIDRELAATKAAVEADSHAYVQLFRPPYGRWDRRVIEQAKALGLVTILWSIDTRDSEGASWRQIAANVARSVEGGSIVLMHENHGQTIRALRFVILPMLKKRGFIPVTVPQLLALDPPSAAQLRQGLAGCYGRGDPEPTTTLYRG